MTYIPSDISTEVLNFEQCCDGYLLGELHIGGTRMHVEALRVDEDGETLCKETSPICVCSGRLRDIQQVDPNSRYRTTEIAEFPGDWIIYAIPSSQF